MPEVNVAASAYIKAKARNAVWRLWLLPAAGLAAIVIGLYADWRWCVVGLMSIFIVFPMAMTLAVLSIGVDAAKLCRVAEVKVSDNGITLYDCDGTLLVSIPLTAITDIRSDRRQFVITCRGHKPDVVIIPAELLTDTDTAVIYKAFEASM